MTSLTRIWPLVVAIALFSSGACAQIYHDPEGRYRVDLKDMWVLSADQPSDGAKFDCRGKLCPPDTRLIVSSTTNEFIAAESTERFFERFKPAQMRKVLDNMVARQGEMMHGEDPVVRQVRGFPWYMGDFEVSAGTNKVNRVAMAATQKNGREWLILEITPPDQNIMGPALLESFVGSFSFE
jgi:hypothetical protein